MKPAPSSSAVTHASTTSEELKAPRLPALLSGLPSSERVRDQLLHLSSSSKVETPTNTFLYPQGLPLPYTEEAHQIFLSEFRQDTHAMIERLLLIKIHVAHDICRGSHFVPTKDNDYFANEPVRIRQLRQLCMRDTDHNASQDTDASSILALYNSLVPERLKLQALRPPDPSMKAAMRSAVSEFTSSLETKEEFKQQLDLILFAVNRALSRLHTMCKAPLLFDLAGANSTHEQALKQSWNDYRLIVKQLSSLYERDSWFSPSSQGTSERQVGPKQGSITAMVTDYQRWAISLSETFARDLQRSRIRDEGVFPRIESTLTSSGMAALNSILDFLQTDWVNQSQQSRRQAPHVVSLGDIYFEVEGAISAFCSNLGAKHRVLDPGDQTKIINHIKKHLPDIIVASPLTNSFHQRTLDLTTIFKSLSDTEWLDSTRSRLFHECGYPKRYLTFLIDNTMLGPTASWLRYRFGTLPAFVRILSFESLIKFGQDGLDLTSAGLVTRIGESVQGDFMRVFRKRAYSISELSLHRLTLTHSDTRLRSKIERHSRNTDILAKELQEIASSDTYIQSVTHPHARNHLSRPAHGDSTDLAGGLLALELKSDFAQLRTATRLREHEATLNRLAHSFESLVLYYAKDLGVEVHVGSSFGFNSTRIAVYYHLGKPFGKDRLEPLIPHLRIAPGTENIKDALLFAAAIRRANEVFSQALRNGLLDDIADRLPRLD